MALRLMGKMPMPLKNTGLRKTPPLNIPNRTYGIPFHKTLYVENTPILFPFFLNPPFPYLLSIFLYFLACF